MRFQLRTFNGLSALIKQTDHYKDSREKNSLLDKVNWLVSYILDINQKNNNDITNYVNISSQKLKYNLGNKYLDVINTLEKEGLIVTNNKYSVNRYTKSYGLTKKLYKGRQIISVEVKSNRFAKKLEKHIKNQQKDVLKNPLYKRVLTNTLKIHFINEFVHYIPLPNIIEQYEVNGRLVTNYEDNRFQLDRYTEFGKILKSIDKETDAEQLFKMNLFFSPSRSEYGRLYHFICSVPSRIRELMRTKENELIYEVDMSSAQLTILILEWIKSGKHNKAKPKEVDHLTQLLLNGNIYNYIQTESSHFRDMSYKDLKTSILKIINARENPGIGNKELMRLFPGFMSWIKRLKEKEGHQYVSHIHQKAESDIFIDVFEKLPNDMFALPIHDCIISNKENTETIKNRLIERFKELYGAYLNPEYSYERVFKVKRVSLKDEDLPSYQENLFAKQEYGH